MYQQQMVRNERLWLYTTAGHFLSRLNLYFIILHFIIQSIWHLFLDTIYYYERQSHITNTRSPDGSFQFHFSFFAG